MKYLVNRKTRKSVAHLWDSTDTYCRMHSTSGLKSTSYEVSDTAANKAVCSICCGAVRNMRLAVVPNMVELEVKWKDGFHEDHILYDLLAGHVYAYEMLWYIQALADFNIDFEVLSIDGYDDTLVVSGSRYDILVNTLRVIASGEPCPKEIAQQTLDALGL